MLPSYANLLILGSALVGRTLAAALPWEDEEDSLESFLQARADDSWAPPGAPPPKPGQTITDYLNNVMGGEGDATNEPNEPHDKIKRQDDGHEATHQFVENPHNSSTKWIQGPAIFEIMVIDGHCPSGFKPHNIAGDVVDPAGNDVKNATIGELISYLWDVRQANKNNIVAREKAYAAWVQKQADLLQTELDATLVNGWICPPPATQTELIRDELRRKLLELNRIQYYLAVISASALSGAVIAGIQAGITHATSEVELGTEAWLNSAIGTALTIFLATEFSRWAPRYTGAEAWSPLVLWAWGRRQVNKSLASLKRTSRSAGAMAGGAASSAAAAANGGQTGPLGNQCVTPDQAVAAAANLVEEGGVPATINAVNNAAAAQGADYFADAGGMGNIVAGQAAGGQCR